jgi:hypothetical protein
MNDATPKTYLYGAILFAVMIIGVVSVLSSLNQSEGGYIGGDERFAEFNSTFNIYDGLVDKTDNIQSSIDDDDNSQFGAFGVLNSLINKAWQTLKGLFKSFAVITNAIGGLSSIFGVPSWVTGAIGLLIVIMIAFSIWGAIFQTKF